MLYAELCIILMIKGKTREEAEILAKQLLFEQMMEEEEEACQKNVG